MSWAKLDDRFPDNPKIAVLSDAAFRAYVTSICYSARELTDGIISVRKAKEWAGRPRVVQELVPALWEPEGNNLRVHDFLEYNPPREQVEAIRQTRAQAGAKGAANRWQSAKQDAEQTDGKTDAPLPVSPNPLSQQPVAKYPQPPTAAEVLAGRPNIFKLYEACFGKGVSPLIADRLKEYEESHSPECVTHCFQEAAESHARSVSLVYKILDRHQAEGCYGFTGRSDSYKPAAAAHTNGVAGGVPNVDESLAALADARRNRTV